MPSVQPLDAKMQSLGIDAAAAVGARFFSEPIGKVEIHRLAASFGIDRIELREMEQGRDAISVERADGGYSLLLNSTDPRVRQRFSAAHEVSHWILTPILGQKVVHIRRFSKKQDPFGDRIEYLCNDMASAILMPTVHVKKILEISLQSARCVPEIARSFDVSFEAAARRFVHLSQGRCALIVWKKSPDGSIRYSRRTISNERLANCLLQVNGQRLSPALRRSTGRNVELIASVEDIVMLGGRGSRGSREVVCDVPVETFVRYERGAPVCWSFVRFDQPRRNSRIASNLPTDTPNEVQLRPQAVQTQLEFAQMD